MSSRVAANKYYGETDQIYMMKDMKLEERDFFEEMNISIFENIYFSIKRLYYAVIPHQTNSNLICETI